MKAKWKPLNRDYHWHYLAPPGCSTSQPYLTFFPCAHERGYTGLCWESEGKARKKKSTEPHLDQINEDMEIPHSNVPPKQLLQLHLMGCKRTITQDAVFPLTLLDAFAAFAVPKALKTEKQSFTTGKFITAKPLNGNSNPISVHMA